MVYLTDEPISPHFNSNNAPSRTSSHRRSSSTSSLIQPSRRSYDQRRFYVPTAAALNRQTSSGTGTMRQSEQQFNRIPNKIHRAEDSPPLTSPTGVHIVENSSDPASSREVHEKIYYPKHQKKVHIRNSGQDQLFPNGNPFTRPRFNPPQRAKSKLLYVTPEIDPDLNEEESENSESRYLTPSEIRKRKLITRSRFFLRLLSTIFAACVCIGIGSVISEYRALRSKNIAVVEKFADPQFQVTNPSEINGIDEPVDERHTMIHLGIGVVTLALTGGLFIISALWNKMRHINPMAIFTNLIISLLIIGLCIGVIICCMERPGQKLTMKQWICMVKPDDGLLCGEIQISFIMSTVVLVLDVLILGNLLWSYLFMRKMVRAKAKWETGRRMRRGFEGARGGSGLGGNVPIGGKLAANEEKERLKSLYEEEEGTLSGRSTTAAVGERQEPVSKFSPDSSLGGSPELGRK